MHPIPNPAEGRPGAVPRRPVRTIRLRSRRWQHPFAARRRKEGPGPAASLRVAALPSLSRPSPPVAFRRTLPLSSPHGAAGANSREQAA